VAVLLSLREHAAKRALLHHFYRLDPGTWTLQLVLDQGAWEEVLTVDADDADNLQDMLSAASVVQYDVRRRTLMFGTTAVGST
jgi:hypothetical protein